MYRFFAFIMAIQVEKEVSIKGKVVLITGAASGIGKAMVKAFLNEGCIVAALDSNAKTLEEIDQWGEPHLKTFKCDISSEKELLSALEKITYDLGSIQVLINNAGILDDFVPVHKLSNLLWERVLRVNLYAAFFLCREILPEMVAKKNGIIINVSSVGGLHGGRAGASYTVSKFGLIGLSQNIAHTYAREGIRCNVIAPGAIKTSIGNAMHPDELGFERSSLGFPLIPINGEPEEIASIALFLAKPDASFINGSVIVADAGWTAY